MKGAALATVAVVGAFVAPRANTEVASWAFLSSVGGFSIGQPTKGGAGWVLPVQGDVSGLRTITTKPTTMNSAIACLETQASVDKMKINLRVITGLAGPGRNAACPAAALGSLAPGRYSVQYRGINEPAVPLGEVVIAP